MNTDTLLLRRTATTLRPDQSRVLLRPFTPGDDARIATIVARVLELSGERVEQLLAEITAEFSPRHEGIEQHFHDRFDEVRGLTSPQIPEPRRLLIGAYFLAEYSLESAALFNPSIVPHLDQTGLAPDALRFILSLRATGEGHISSITFRTGIIHGDRRIEVSPPATFLSEPRKIPNPVYEKALFTRKLQELGCHCAFTHRVLDPLGDCFALQDLRASIDALLGPAGQREGVLHEDLRAAESIWILAQSNYDVQFAPGQEISARILFPATPSQRNGIEDARFVRFATEGGTHLYYATFTAFDGRVVMPELVETADFLRFRFITLNGPAAKNKGMALFPRKINGRYAMLSRQDNESIFLMYSDNVHFWDECQLLLTPRYPWELVQLGNCGSPIETDEGWLVLSHGVGPMRKYCIGAFLLDRDDPSKVIGRLRQPLLQPNQNERDGYVPNVVYTCGAILHRGDLIIPYGIADHATGFATVPVADVLAAMLDEI